MTRAAPEQPIAEPIDEDDDSARRRGHRDEGDASEDRDTEAMQDAREDVGEGMPRRPPIGEV